MGTLEGELHDPRSGYPAYRRAFVCRDAEASNSSYQ